MPAADAVSTIEPSPRIAAIAAFSVRKAPSRLTAMTRRHSARLSRLIGAAWPIPAFTTAWVRPVRSSAATQCLVGDRRDQQLAAR
jgi:hypothetical protein